MRIRNIILGTLVVSSLFGCGDDHEMAYQANDSEDPVVSAPTNFEITEHDTRSPTDLIAIREANELQVQDGSVRFDEIPPIFHQKSTEMHDLGMASTPRYWCRHSQRQQHTLKPFRNQRISSDVGLLTPKREAVVVLNFVNMV